VISKIVRLTLFLLLSSLLTIYIAAHFGGSSIPFFDIFKDEHRLLVLNLRLPRLLLDFAAGAGLSVVGLVFQTYFRNPLAEPFILGISGAAATGYVLSMMFLSSLTFAAPVLAFTFALGTIWFVYRLTGRYFQVNLGALILIGVGFNFLYSSFITVSHLLFSDRFSKNILYWYMGNTDGASLNTSLIGIFIILVLSLILYYDSAKLNIYQLGTAITVNSGVNIDSLTKRVYLIGSLITALIVSLCGTIGFVGLVVPHIIKHFMGSDHRLSMIGTFFLGGIFMVIIDTLFKVVFFPVEIPIGVLTALTGAPFFIYILRRVMKNG